MHLLLPRNVSVNRTLAETLKKIPLQPSGDRAPHHQHAECPRRRQDEKVIRAAAVTGIPGWPRLLSGCGHPAHFRLLWGVRQDARAEGAGTQAFRFLEPRATWGWDGLGEDPSEAKQDATPSRRASWPVGMRAGQGPWQRGPGTG